MENASKALIMAAGILLGIMIISLGAYLFKTFGSTGAEITKTLAQREIDKFNVQFTKYEGQKTCTAHDIVSVANLAVENNKQYYSEQWKSSKNDPYYISVRVDNTYYFEQNDESFFISFLKANSVNETDGSSIKFECKLITMNQETRRIDSIVFQKIR